MVHTDSTGLSKGNKRVRDKKQRDWPHLLCRLDPAAEG